MTKQNFIFSNERRHRMARHLAFWGGWCVAYLLLFQYPIHTFAGWGFSEAESADAFDAIQQSGLPLFVLRTLIFNSLLAVVVPQAIFTYVLIYWVLPNYFFKKRNVFVIAFILIILFVSYYFIAAQFKVFSPLGDYIFGLIKHVPKHSKRLIILYIYVCVLACVCVCVCVCVCARARARVATDAALCIVGYVLSAQGAIEQSSCYCRFCSNDKTNQTLVAEAERNRATVP